MEKLKTRFHFIFGNVHVPAELLNTNEKVLLHISDTPVCFYPALKKLVRKLSPDYIIHTGDLVDDLKLENYPNRIDEYKARVMSIIKILENSSANNIYVCIGNHDDKSIVKNIAKRSIIVDHSLHLNIEGLEMTISHYPNEIRNSPSKYNLFGHDITLSTKREENTYYLNGITSVNIISLGKKTIYYLPYPYGTNDSRLGKSKIGL